MRCADTSSNETSVIHVLAMEKYQNKILKSVLIMDPIVPQNNSGKMDFLSKQGKTNCSNTSENMKDNH